MDVLYWMYCIVLYYCSITKTTIPNTFLGNFVIMLCIRIYAFLLVLGLINYYTTRDSLSVYIRSDKAGFQISSYITRNIKNSTDLRVSEFHDVFFISPHATWYAI